MHAASMRIPFPLQEQSLLSDVQYIGLDAVSVQEQG